MKKLSIVLTLLLLICNMMPASYASQLDSTNKTSNISDCTYNAKSGDTFFISEGLAKGIILDNDDALKYIDDMKKTLNMASAYKELELKESFKDDIGFSTYKYQQKWNDVPVYGNELILHIGKSFEVTAVTGNYRSDVMNASEKNDKLISLEDAGKIAAASVKAEKTAKYSVSKSQVVWYKDKSSIYQKCYHFEISAYDSISGYRCYDVFVSAADGTIVDKISRQSEISATGSMPTPYTNPTEIKFSTEKDNDMYYLKDNERKIEVYDASGINGDYDKLPGDILTDKDNIWKDSVQKSGVYAYYNLQKIYDYYKNNFKRSSIDGKGTLIKVATNYGDKYCGAFWDGNQIAFGDGDGILYGSLPKALDIVGHEYTHGIIDNTAGLVNYGQSGALAESFADAFGNLIENKPDENWKIGEDAYTPDLEGDAIRLMSDPTLTNDPDNMSKYVNTDIDNGGVHTNAGIPNKAFYNLVQKVSREDAAKIWYRALTQYFTPKTDFSYAMMATVTAAKDIFGKSDEHVNAVMQAWDLVGVKEPAEITIVEDKNESEVETDVKAKKEEDQSKKESYKSDRKDEYESNDSFYKAYDFGKIDKTIDISANLHNSNDEDWYEFKTGNECKETVVTLKDSDKDYDIEVYDSYGHINEYDETTDEVKTIIFPNTPNETYYIKIFSKTGTVDSDFKYALEVKNTDSPIAIAIYPQNGSQSIERDQTIYILYNTDLNTDKNIGDIKITDKDGKELMAWKNRNALLSDYKYKLTDKYGNDLTTVKDKKLTLDYKISGNILEVKPFEYKVNYSTYSKPVIYPYEIQSKESKKETVNTYKLNYGTEYLINIPKVAIRSKEENVSSDEQLKLVYKVKEYSNYILNNVHVDYTEFKETFLINGANYDLRIQPPVNIPSSYTLNTKDKTVELNGTALCSGKLSVYTIDQLGKKNYYVIEEKIIKDQKVINTIDMNDYSATGFSNANQKICDLYIDYTYHKTDGSEYTEKYVVNVSLDTKAPIIQISNLKDKTINDTAKFTCSIDEECSLEVNGTKCENGSKSGNGWTYSREVPLEKGENTITIKATDLAGNTTTEVRKVTRE